MSQLTKNSSIIQVCVTMSQINSGHSNLHKRQRTTCLSTGLEDSILPSPSVEPWEDTPFCIRSGDLIPTLVPVSAPAHVTPLLTCSHHHQYWGCIPSCNMMRRGITYSICQSKLLTPYILLLSLIITNKIILAQCIGGTVTNQSPIA